MTRTPEQARERLAALAWAGALLILVVGGAVAWRSFVRYGDDEGWVRHTHQVIADIEGATADLAGAETAVRGYLLSGDVKRFPGPEAAEASLRRRLDELRRLTADNPRQQQRLQRLGPVLDARFARLRELQRLRREQGFEAAQRAFAAGPGDASAQSIDVLSDMRTDEEQLLGERLLRAQAGAFRVSLLLASVDVLALVAVSTAMLLLGRRVFRLQSERATQLNAQSVGRERMLFSRALQELPVGVAVADPAGRLVAANDELVRICGRRPTSGAPAVQELTTMGLVPRSGAHPLERALQGERVTSMELRLPAGAIVAAGAAPVHSESGELLAVVLICEDVTRQRGEQLDRERESRFRELFTGVLGHDLRNPLSVVTTGVRSLLRRDSLLPEQHQVLERIQRSAERMGRMVDQLLDLTHARIGGALEVSRRASELGELCRAAVEETEVENPGAALRLEVGAPLPARVDPDRVLQLLRHLLSNAVRHARAGTVVEMRAHLEEGPEGGPLAAEGTGRVPGAEGGSASFARRGNPPRVPPIRRCAVLEVHNQGDPIPPEEQEAIFDPFHRGPAFGSGGLGIGLYIARQIALAHGGDLAVRSPDAGGTTFRVQLPLGDA